MMTVMLVAVVLPCAAQRPVREGPNLCYNGTLDNPTNSLAGWTSDYRWLGNKNYMANHTRVSVLPGHRGKQNVLFINGNKETKVESKPIPFEKGARYRCTMDLLTTCTPHIYFAGYKWQPGVRPYEDPHLGDLRNIYRSKRQRVRASSWKRITFEFPQKNLSKLAMKHLKYVRFFTVYIIVVDGAFGQVYVDNVKVTRIE
jgi:hypothetical protein